MPRGLAEKQREFTWVQSRVHVAGLGPVVRVVNQMLRTRAYPRFITARAAITPLALLCSNPRVMPAPSPIA